VWGNIKSAYVDKGMGFGDLLKGIEVFEANKVKEKEDYADLIKASVNLTLGKSHQEMNKAMDNFLGTID
jgi:hypothetical protein